MSAQDPKSNGQTAEPKTPPSVPAKTLGSVSSAEAESGGLSAESAPEAKPLELPRGAMLTMRVSGGIRFTTQDMVIYPDGRVTHGGGDTGRTVYQRASRVLNDAQIVKLRRMLDQSGFFRMKPPKGEQSQDSYAYEIVARVGTKHNRIEVFTGTMPEPLNSLIEQLMKWMPPASE